MSQVLAWRIVPRTLGFDVPDSAAQAAARMGLGRMAMAPGPGALEAAWILALDDAANGVVVDSLLLARLSADSSLSARYLGSILQGVELARRGRADSALDVTATAIIDDSSGAIGSAFARSVLHVHRGTWHHALGRPADADRSWLYYENSHLRGYPDGIVQAGEVDAVLSGFVRLLRAELALEVGNLARACRLAHRVRELWKDADPELVPLVTRAERVASQCR